LLEAGLIDPDYLIADVKSGVSGAGRKASVAALMGEVGESFKAYALPGHRHLPEIRQTLRKLANRDIGLTFAPHLLPMIRGIEASLYARMTQNAIDLQALFEQRYAAEPFIDVMPAGSHPETRTVRGINVCRIAVHTPQEGQTVVVSSVIDNLVKGAAGQALQNMNLMLGFDETAGLGGVALLP
jgi:N-acetyl-gamma-glutamyl-phosphate reductase